MIVVMSSHHQITDKDWLDHPLRGKIFIAAAHLIEESQDRQPV